MNCPLCRSQKSSEYFDVTERVFKVPRQRTYQLCNMCSLVFLNPEHRLDPGAEKARYDTHENSLEQEGYTNFLLQMWGPLKTKLKSSALGLDYGCGPTPALAQLIENDGFKIETYDPFYKPEFNFKKYDFITCTEVLEHVFDLNKVFEHLDMLLVEGGYFAVMTEVLSDKINFPKWRYRDDDTHVCFFQPATIKFIADNFSYEIDYFDEQRVVIFKKVSV